MGWNRVVPFTDDHRLVEYVFNIPAVYKIRKGVSKYLLREAMKDFIPQKVYTREDKMGFNTPHNAWLKKIKRMKCVRCLIKRVSNYIDLEKLDKNYGKLFSFGK
jgi:asparagine synthase (glutamine-hydrolysing)